MKKHHLLFLSLLVSAFVFTSCNDDEEEDTTPDPSQPVALNATSTAQFKITTGSSVVQGTAGSVGFEALTVSQHDINDVSTYNYGHEISNEAWKGLTLEFGPHSTPGTASQATFYSFVTEGPLSFSSGKIRITYRDGLGGEFFSDDHTQTGSTFMLEDVVYTGDYIRFYATFTCKLISGSQNTTGHMVGALYRF